MSFVENLGSLIWKLLQINNLSKLLYVSFDVSDYASYFCVISWYQISKTAQNFYWMENVIIITHILAQMLLWRLTRSHASAEWNVHPHNETDMARLRIFMCTVLDYELTHAAAFVRGAGAPPSVGFIRCCSHFSAQNWGTEGVCHKIRGNIRNRKFRLFCRYRALAKYMTVICCNSDDAAPRGGCVDRHQLICMCFPVSLWSNRSTMSYKSFSVIHVAIIMH